MQVTVQTTQTATLTKSEVLRVAARAICEAANFPFDVSANTFGIESTNLVKIAAMHDGTPYSIKVRCATETDRAAVHILQLLKSR
jgi:hypothetical protein